MDENTIQLSMVESKVKKNITILNFINLGLFIITQIWINKLHTLILYYIVPAYAISLVVWFFFPNLLHRELFLTFNEDGITGRISYSKEIKYKWKNIASIKASLLKFTIIANNGEEININLDSTPYEQHKSVKPKFYEFAKSKGIPVVE